MVGHDKAHPAFCQTYPTSPQDILTTSASGKYMDFFRIMIFSTTRRYNRQRTSERASVQPADWFKATLLHNFQRTAPYNNNNNRRLRCRSMAVRASVHACTTAPCHVSGQWGSGCRSSRWSHPASLRHLILSAPETLSLPVLGWYW